MSGQETRKTFSNPVPYLSRQAAVEALAINGWQQTDTSGSVWVKGDGQSRIKAFLRGSASGHWEIAVQ